jgi:hypothetical protein
LVILGAAAAVGIATHGLKESPTVTPNSNQPQTSVNPIQPTSSSTLTKVIWPTNQELNVGQPVSNLPTLVSELSGPAGNRIADVYLSAYQEVQKNKDSYKEVNFNATVYQYLPLRDFLNGFDISIDSNIYDLLDQADYRIVFCYRDANNTDRGLKFATIDSTDPSFFEQLYAEIDSRLKNWEPTMFSDLQNIFSPTGVLSKSIPKFQDGIYRDRTGGSLFHLPFRYAAVRDQKGEESFLYYAFFEENFFIANSQTCLDHMLYAAKPETGS